MSGGLGVRREQIAARFAKVTGQPVETMQRVARHFLPDAFSAADGSLDVDAVDEYAAGMLGGSVPTAGDPVRDSLSRSGSPSRRGGIGMTERRANVAAGKPGGAAAAGRMRNRRDATRERLERLNGRGAKS